METIRMFMLAYGLPVCAYGCAWLADEKGYSGWIGLLVGVATGPLGVLIYAGAPDKQPEYRK